MKTVKDLLKIALREVKIYSPQLSTDDDAWGDSYNFYVDMLKEYELQGVYTGFPIPSGMSDPVGTGLITGTELAYLLMSRIASFFDHSLDRNQSGKADRANSNLLAQQTLGQMKKNYVPSGYWYYNRYPVSCCDCECGGDDPCCECGGGSSNEK